MARRGGSKLLRREADDIATKLGATIETGGKHLHALIYQDDRLILQFGIRHGKKATHGHLPSTLHVSESYLMKLARCQISSDEYFSHLETLDLI